MIVAAPNSLSLPLPPDYAQIRPIVVGQPLRLKGTYDEQTITQLQLTREDGIAWPIDYAQGRWQVLVESGWATVGAHWLQMQGYDRAGHLIAAPTFHFIVCPDATIANEPLRLRALNHTWFKAKPEDSTQLSNAEKVRITAGQTLDVLRYGLSASHFKLVLAHPVAPIGSFGYVNTIGAELVQGDIVYRLPPLDVPECRRALAQLQVKHTTYLKTQLADSTHLTSAQKQQLIQGQVIPLTQYSRCDEHWRVSLPTADIASPAWLPTADVKLVCQGQPIMPDPAGLTMEILQTTPLKQHPRSPVALSRSETASLAAGSVYDLVSYTLVGEQLQVTYRSANDQGCATGYLDPDHVLLRRGSQVVHPVRQQVELYLAGHHREPQVPDREWPIGNIITLAAVLRHYGNVVTSDDDLEATFLDWCFEHYGPGSQIDQRCLQALLAAHGYRLTFYADWTTADLRAILNRQIPVVVNSRFTPAQHLVAVLGYGRRGWLVFDPWGDATTGYRCLDGDRVWYPADYFADMVGDDGTISAATIQPSPIDIPRLDANRMLPM
jgi:hypothetical protein